MRASLIFACEANFADKLVQILDQIMLGINTLAYLLFG
jgi:hypothetical protein